MLASEENECIVVAELPSFFPIVAVASPEGLLIIAFLLLLRRVAIYSFSHIVEEETDIRKKVLRR